MLKLDKKDKQLIYELSNNARTSHTQLAKRIGLSKSSVKYRIERLKELGVIERFTAVINLGATGAETAVLLIRFNDHITDEIKEYFRKETHADWVITLSGQWDILAEMAFKTYDELGNIMRRLREHFKGKISDLELIFSSKAIRVEHLVKDFYKELGTKTVTNAPRTTERIILDETDKKILRELSQNSESSIVEIAKKVGKAIDTVSSRIKELLAKKIIVKFFTEINLSKLGYTEYIYKIKLSNLDDRINSLVADIRANDNVKYAFLDMTGTHIVINLAYKEAKDIDEFSSELRRKYHSIIDTQDNYLVKEQLKFDLFPEGIAQK